MATAELVLPKAGKGQIFDDYAFYQLQGNSVFCSEQIGPRSIATISARTLPSEGQ